jgi:hypothetical protein
MNERRVSSTAGKKKGNFEIFEQTTHHTYPAVSRAKTCGITAQVPGTGRLGYCRPENILLNRTRTVAYVHVSCISPFFGLSHIAHCDVCLRQKYSSLEMVLVEKQYYSSQMGNSLLWSLCDRQPLQ